MVPFLGGREIMNIKRMMDAPIHLASTKCGQNPTSAGSAAGLSASAPQLETMGLDGYSSQQVD
jgi:hypothetical protein